MSESKQEAIRFALTVPVIMGHPHLIEPQAFQDPKTKKPKGDPKYSAIFCLDPQGPDLKAIKEAMAKAAKAFNPNAVLNQLKFPLQAGEKAKAAYVASREKKGKTPADDGRADFQLGKIVIKASSKYQPKLAVLEGGKVIDLTEQNIALHKNKFYFGTEALAQFNFVGYPGQNGAPDGVTAYLDVVVSLNRGEKLNAGISASEVFKGVVGNYTDADPTGGAGFEANDEIPF